jgi:hypothetical protein
MGLVISVSVLVRIVVVGFVLGVVIGWYVGTGGPTDVGPPHPKPPVETVNPEAAR